MLEQVEIKEAIEQNEFLLSEQAVEVRYSQFSISQTSKNPEDMTGLDSEQDEIFNNSSVRSPTNTSTSLNSNGH